MGNHKMKLLFLLKYKMIWVNKTKKLGWVLIIGKCCSNIYNRGWAEIFSLVPFQHIQGKYCEIKLK